MDNQPTLHLILLLAKTLEGSNSVVAKIILNSSGIPVLLVHLYTSLCSCIFFLLAGFFIEGNKLPLTNRNVQLKLLAAGLLSFTGQLSSVYALNFTSPELVSVIFCTLPLMSSIIAIVFRVENIRLTRYDGQVKILGILVAVCGTLLTAVYQGPKLLGTGISLWHLGWLLSLMSSFCIAVEVNVKAPVLKTHQAPWSILAFCTITNLVLSTLTCLVLVRHWPLPSQEAFLGLAYTGTIGSVGFGLISWVISKGGLFLVCCYSAVSPVSATVLSLIILGSSLYTGSVFGAMLVVCGVILCGWSESETKKMASLASPLL